MNTNDIVMVVGGAGREHAMCWKLAQSPHVQKIYCVPGNPGTAMVPKVQNVVLDILDPLKLLGFALERKVDFTIIGPEQPLSIMIGEYNIVDIFKKMRLRIFGPGAKSFRLEFSKTFTKNLLHDLNIPTASFISTSNFEYAKLYILTREFPNDRIVIKADGLCAGKGVYILDNKDEAIEVANRILNGKIFDKAGESIVIEDFLDGVEASLIALVDGRHVLPFQLVQDYKKLSPNRGAPNTGGLGSYAPFQYPDGAFSKAIHNILDPVIEEMWQINTPFTGFLYAGLCIVDGVPNVLEFNARLGDPEAQVLMLNIESDFYETISNAVNGGLSGKSLEWKDQYSTGVIAASGGYPDSRKIMRGNLISGLDFEMEGSMVFHSGTVRDIGGTIRTDGGRVLCVCGSGSTLEASSDKAYERMAHISFDNMYFRSDIGKEVSRTSL